MMGAMTEMSAPGPRQRDIVSGEGAAVFEMAVSHGWIDGTDPAFAPGTPRREVLDLLVEIGLLRLEAETNRYHPLDPAAAGDQLVVPMSQRGSELLTESARWSETFSRLAQTYRSSGTSLKRSITEVHGVAKINAYIDALLAECREELLTAQPHGRRSPTVLAQAESRDVQALKRGVSMRTLYQHSARQSQPTRQYVAEISVLGAEVRTLDEFFKRLLIFDRYTAIIPGTENDQVAVAIHDKSVVTYLVDIFERAWERAQPFNVSGTQAERHIAEDVRAMTIRLLVEGHSDPASAKRLGVSTRTYAGYIAALKDEYDVQTRFQLGYAMGRDTSKRSAPSSDTPGGDLDLADLDGLDDEPDGER